MDDIVVSNDLTPQKVVGNLQSFIEFSDDKLDYLGAFLDVETNYYEHTGTQTLARRLIERAVAILGTGATSSWWGIVWSGFYRESILDLSEI